MHVRSEYLCLLGSILNVLELGVRTPNVRSFFRRALKCSSENLVSHCHLSKFTVVTRIKEICLCFFLALWFITHNLRWNEDCWRWCVEWKEEDEKEEDSAYQNNRMGVLVMVKAAELFLYMFRGVFTRDDSK